MKSVQPNGTPRPWSLTQGLYLMAEPAPASVPRYISKKHIFNTLRSSLLVRAAAMHHVDPSGAYQPCMVGMMHEYRQRALQYYATFKG